LEAELLSSRTGTILKSIVGQYIVRAIPVPSQSIVDDHELGVSSATIRNEMALLEHEGYIIRPHTSSGSVPTDKGYRYYVESLSDIELPSSERTLIGHLFHQVEGDLEEWLSLAATLIARLVHNVAVVTVPKSAHCEFRYLELVSLRDSRALMVLVLHGARVKQQLLALEQLIFQPELTAIANKLNAAYVGMSCSQILANNIELSPVEQQVKDCLVNMMQAEDEQEYEEPYLEGWHFMLGQPEFAQGNQMLPLMELVERRSLLKTVFPPVQESQGVQVVIGKENKVEVVRNYSVVFRQYGLPEEATGTIGVIGPTRMPYARAISTVDYISLVLSELAAELY